MEFLVCPLISSFSSTKLVSVLLVVCVCCLWLLPSFSSNSFLSSSANFFSFAVVSSTASLSISFFCLHLLHMNYQSIWFIWIANPYDSYILIIHMKQIDYQSVWTIQIGFIWIVNPYGSYGLLIHMNHIDCQSVWIILIVNPYGSYEFSYGLYGLLISIRSIYRKEKNADSKLMAAIAERRQTPTTSTRRLMKMNHKLKMREFRGEMKNVWMNGADERIPNLYFTFKR